MEGVDSGKVALRVGANSGGYAWALNETRAEQAPPESTFLGMVVGLEPTTRVKAIELMRDAFLSQLGFELPTSLVTWAKDWVPPQRAVDNRPRITEAIGDFTITRARVPEDDAVLK
jgi:hypothetical protein